MNRLTALSLALLALVAGANDRLDRRPTADLLLNVTWNSGASLDRSPLSRTATDGSSATKSARSVDMDGTSNAYVSFPDAADLETVPLSAFCWVYIDTYSGTRSLISKCTTSGTYEGWLLYTGVGLGRGLSLLQIDSATLPATTNYAAHWTSTAALTAGAWYHVGFTLASLGATPVLYINGAAATIASSATSGTVSSFASSATLRLAGVGSPDATTVLDGRLDGVLIFNRVLSAAEVGALYIEGHP